jgi:hypothetical protein
VVAYHVAINGQAAGQFDLATLTRMAQAGQLTTASLVWKAGMSGWEQAGTVNELTPIFSQMPPAVPPVL